MSWLHWLYKRFSKEWTPIRPSDAPVIISEGCWKDDREWLRQMAREKPIGLRATMIYTLISHMQRRLHMMFYALKAGGWRGRPWSAKMRGEEWPQLPSLSEKKLKQLRGLYKDYAQEFFEASAVSSLDDQAAWIKAKLLESGYRCYLYDGGHPLGGKANKELREIGWRVLANAYKPQEPR